MNRNFAFAAVHILGNTMTKSKNVFLAATFLAAGGFMQLASAKGAITLTDANTEDNPKTYTSGPYFVPTAQLGCDPTFAPCDDTTLTVNVSPAVTAGKRIVVDASWGEPIQADFDLFVTQGTNAIADSASTTDPEVARFDANNGNYLIHVEPYQPFGNTLTVKVYLEPLPPLTPANSGPVARYQVYAPPASLPYPSGGEPSIGVNTKTGVTAVGNYNSAMFVTWNDNTSPATATWRDSDAFTNDLGQFLAFDPILFTDRETGLTIVSQLTGDLGFDGTGVVGCSLSSISYDDGVTWIPSEGCGPPAGIDHQAIGGGPYHSPIPALPALPDGVPASIARHAVYYCAQSFGVVIGDATCSRSDDGGLTYNPAVVVYTSECGGIHGHPRVSPEGTVFLPNKDCAGTVSLGQGIAYSTTNGLTWAFSLVPGSTPGDSDPSVATGLNNTGKPSTQAHNTVYFGYCDGDGHAKVSMSRDEGATFSEGIDVGSAANIKNCVFPEMIAGDDNRAALFFLGTTRGGGYQAADFTGEWHAYVATTYDGGATWGLFDATPNDPVQMGCVWMGGGGNVCRNMLDFNDIALDKEGRPNFVFADGCLPSHGCISGSSPSSSHQALNTIGRQSGGKTLFSQYDSTVGAKLIVPGAPKLLSADPATNGIALKWAVPDDGGSPLTAYKVYRGTAAGQEQLLKTVSPNKPQFLDNTTSSGTTYFYKVSAVNAVGEGLSYGELSAAGVTPANTAPVASLSSDVTEGLAPLDVTFTVDGSDADGDPLTFDLDYGDNSAHGNSSGPHTYSAAGTYTATLTVSDGRGGSDSKSLTITAGAPAVNHAPVATLSPASASIHAGEAVPFDVSATDADGDTLTIDLDFGDDTQPHGASTGTNGHTYVNAGSYTATLTVSDGHGGSNVKTATVDVTAPAPQEFTVHLATDKSSGDVTYGPLAVTFTATVGNDDGTPIQYTFAFGDGETSTITQSSNVITHEYAYAGTYHPYVTAVQDYGSRGATSSSSEAIVSTTSHVDVSGTLIAKLAYNLPSGNVAPADIVFDTTGSQGDTWRLEFGDGAVATGTGAPASSVTHRYAAPGTYAATLYEYGSGTAQASQSQTVTIVAKQQLTAQLQLSASSGTSPLSIALDGCHSIPANDGTHIVSFTVDYGDGSPAETKTVDAAHVVDCAATDRSSDPSYFTHTYTTGQTQTYFPTLTVADNASTPRTMRVRDSKGVSVTAPAAVPTSGGRGGAFGWLTLLPMLGAAALRRRRS